MPTAKMTSKGQVTIPAETRARLRLVPGSKIEFEQNAAGETVLRIKTGDIRQLKGIFRHNGPPVSIEDMKQAVGQAIVEKYERSAS